MRILRAECGYTVARRILRYRLDHPDMAWQIENRECPACGAPPGELCRRENGLVAWYHVPRTGDFTA